MKNSTKTIIIAAIAAAVFCLTAVTVLAVDLVEGTGTTDVQYVAGESYTVTIPATQTFTEDSKAFDATVSASGVHLPAGSTLQVSCASANGYKLKCGTANAELPYTVTKSTGGKLAGTSISTILQITGENTSGETTLSFAIENFDGVTVAGTYTDTLTFTAEVY